MEAPEQDHYAVLGVQLSATAAQIKLAYHKLAIKLHPDKNDNSEESTAAFQKLQKALEILLDPARRRVYDIKYPVIKVEWARYAATTKKNAAAPQQAKPKTQRPEPQRAGPSNTSNGPRRKTPNRGRSPPGSSSSSSPSRFSPHTSEGDLTDDEYSGRPRTKPFRYEARPDPRYEDGQPYTGPYYKDLPPRPNRPQTRRGYTDEDGYRQEHPPPRSSSPRAGEQPHGHGRGREGRREEYGREGTQTRSQHDQRGRQRPRAQSWVDTEEGLRIRALAAHVSRTAVYITGILDGAADEIACGVPPGDQRISRMLARAMREVDKLGAQVGRVKEDMDDGEGL